MRIKIHPKVFFLAIFLSISLVLMLLSQSREGLPARIRETSYDIVGPLQFLSLNLKRGLTGFIEDIYKTDKIRKENQKLKRKIEELLFKQRNYYQEVLSSNQRLRELLNFKQRESYSLIPLEVIAYAPHNYFKVVFISGGKEEGLTKEMVVVHPQGLVGRITEVYPHRAKVLLIIDERSKVGVRDQRTRDIAILQGKGKERVCELKYLLTKANVKVGDKLVTSGLGGL
ncbi:MAG: rod shape-determining protein MreC, partial [Candidatus Aerophobetes bacterium]|nr:rod shape-determining protein MreC [Candidatus Aerophobetes bacterium]